MFLTYIRYYSNFQNVVIGGGHVKKQKNLVFKLSLLVIGIFLSLFITYSIISNQMIYVNTKEDKERYVQSLTLNSKKAIQQSFDNTIVTLNSDADLVVSMHKNNQLLAENLIAYKEQALQTHENIFGYSIIINANEMTPSTVQTSYINSENLFVPYSNRSGNTISTIALGEVMHESWYQEPITSLKTYVSDPYEYDLNGKKMMLVSVAKPIIVDGKPIGVTIADFSLDFLDGIVKEHVPETAVQRVLTANGTILTDSADTANHQKNIREFFDGWTATDKQLQQNKDVQFYINSKTLDRETFTVFLPIKIDDAEHNWSVLTIIPKSTITSTFNDVLQASIIAAIVISLLLATLVYFFIHRNLKPLQHVQHALVSAAAGTLTQTIDEQLLKNDEIGAVGKAYNYMRRQMHEVISNVTNASSTVQSKSESIEKVVHYMTQSSNEMTKAVEEIAQGAQAQAEEIEKSNNEMISLGEKIDVLSNLSHAILHDIHRTSEQAKSGVREAMKLRDNSLSTNEVNKELEQQMASLANQIANIDSVMTSIQAITAQTNLLALNASIEAARAGEHGKGFAVVAEEVRKLAEQSHAETENVQRIVTSILQETRQTSAIVQKNSELMSIQNASVTSTEHAFNEQLARAEAIQQKINEFIEKLQAMLQEKELVAHGIQSIAAISEQSAASAEEVTASFAEQLNEIEHIAAMMTELKQIADELKTSTTQFTL